KRRRNVREGGGDEEATGRGTRGGGRQRRRRRDASRAIVAGAPSSIGPTRKPVGRHDQKTDKTGNLPPSGLDKPTGVSYTSGNRLQQAGCGAAAPNRLGFSLTSSSCSVT